MAEGGSDSRTSGALTPSSVAIPRGVCRDADRRWSCLEERAVCPAALLESRRAPGVRAGLAVAGRVGASLLVFGRCIGSVQLEQFVFPCRAFLLVLPQHCFLTHIMLMPQCQQCRRSWGTECSVYAPFARMEGVSCRFPAQSARKDKWWPVACAGLFSRLN